MFANTRIHLIDDDADLRETLARGLAVRTRATVVQWDSAEAFLARAATLEPALILVDYRMRGATGLDLLQAISGDPRFVAVLMTGAADIPLAIEAIRAGAVHLIEKPFKNEELMHTLEEAHERLEAMEPIIAARARLARLSPRERDVVNGLVAGSSNKEIARDLGISPRTVEVYRATLSNKLGVRTLADIVKLVLTSESSPESARKEACFAD